MFSSEYLLDEFYTRNGFHYQLRNCNWISHKTNSKDGVSVEDADSRGVKKKCECFEKKPREMCGISENKIRRVKLHSSWIYFIWFGFGDVVWGIKRPHRKTGPKRMN